MLKTPHSVMPVSFSSTLANRHGFIGIVFIVLLLVLLKHLLLKFKEKLSKNAHNFQTAIEKKSKFPPRGFFLNLDSFKFAKS
jgi:hypothetical protein